MFRSLRLLNVQFPDSFTKHFSGPRFGLEGIYQLLDQDQNRPNRPYAIRKPKDYRVDEPGDLVQIDTLDMHPFPQIHFKHFTARDVISRWDVIETFPSASSAGNHIKLVCWQTLKKESRHPMVVIGTKTP